MTSKDKEKHLEILKNLPTNKRLESAFELYEFARNRVASEIRRQNPQMEQSELNKEIYKRFIRND
ncbi:MAG: hypothetical protein KJ732_02150 [Candidatus Margulisbacteria bacterium]|nr:hypothetical protein [Candidatus Margulisiibacteriota bacterium]